MSKRIVWYSCNCKHPIPRKRFSFDSDGYQGGIEKVYYFVCKNCEMIIDWDYIELFGIDNLKQC